VVGKRDHNQPASATFRNPLQPSIIVKCHGVTHVIGAMLFEATANEKQICVLQLFD